MEKGMSNSSYTELAKARRNWKDEHLSVYLRSGGAEGHVMDVTDIGGHKFTTMLLLKYVGRKSGKTMITPLIYGDIGGEVVIVASKGGADHHPAWYLNVKDSKELSFQIATQAYRASWREPHGAERIKVWDFMVGVFPPYRTYQASTQREIPLVMMSVIGPADRFSE
jgi:deazaflavin-dependent oxidoreductase (nitroreductase family)